MPKTKISEYSATANSNTDVASINIDEGCAPSGINNAIRAVMGHLKDFQQGTNGDPFNGPVNGTLGATTPSTGAFTTLSATGNVTLGDASTDTLNVGNGGLIKDASGNVGVGVTPSANAGVSTLNIANYNRTLSALTLGSNGNSAGYVGYNMGNTSTANLYRYIASDTGSAIYFAGNEMRFMQFASGSAGATTSGTQAMTLDASGNLLVGGTSSLSGSAGRTDFTLNGSSSGGIISFGTGGVRKGYLYQDSSDFNIANEVAGNIRFLNNGTERARFNSTGALVFTGGTTTANGIGITFPATQSASSDANTLDDYEEGTFTPTIGGATTAGTGTYPTDGQVGRYTKIGNRCTFVIWLNWTNLTGSSGFLQVYGLPFTQKAVTNVYTPLTVYMDTALTLSANNVFQAYIIGSSTNIFLSQYVTGGGNAASVPLDTAAGIMISGTYETS